MKLVRSLEGWNGTAELYEANGSYYIVSTIILGEGLSPEKVAFIELGNFAGNMLGYTVADVGQEETLVFKSNERGDDCDTLYVDEKPVSAVGPGSRDKVLERLATITG